MKAKKVYEFRQGDDPYKTMGIGSDRPYKIGDILESREDIFKYYRRSASLDRPYDYRTIPRAQNCTHIFYRGEKYEIREINDKWYNEYNYEVGSEPWGTYQFSELELKKYFERR
jgi:hypothetical protein